MPTPRLNMSAFVRYTNAPPKRRQTRARSIREQSSAEYNPGTDFWRRMRLAIYNDRRTTRDGSVVQDAVLTAIAKKRPSFQAVADKWPSIAARWDGSEFRVPGTSTVVIGGLEIGVKPLFCESWPDGSNEDILVWMNEEQPGPESIDGALRLLSRADVSPNAIATFVDARRGQVWTSADRDLSELDEWLDEIGAAFLRDLSS